jgi:polyvinyl alcohol dehydrogenase (cytochrome)
MKPLTSMVLRWCVGTAFCAVGPAALAADWPSAGFDLANSRYQTAERAISPSTVGSLQLRWQLTTDGDVTANPAIDGDFLYFPDMAGSLYKVHKSTGALVWKKPIAQYTGIAGDFARASPVVAGNALILGNQAGKLADPKGAVVFAVDKHTGDLLWNTKVDGPIGGPETDGFKQRYSFITHSAIVADGKVIVGLASNEELIAGFVPKAYWTWNFRGSVVALDAATGAVQWRTYMVPQGYHGAAVWGSTGAVDLKRKLVFMATGNNYMVPNSVLDCLNVGGSPAVCMSADNHFNSIVAMDLASGAIKWAARGMSYDAWNVGCGLDVPGVFTVPPNDNCPNPKGPDWDFAQGPMLFSGKDEDGEDGKGKYVGAGQKSGMFWTFRAKDGKPVWSRQVAPPGLTGGLQWGSATDGERIFVAVANSGLTGSGTTPGAWALKDGTTTTAGGWASLDAKEGHVNWTTKDPLGSRAEAAVSGANGVVFGCNLDQVNGTMYALHARTGQVLWSHNSGSGASPFVTGIFGACNAGPSIADGMVFWGTGTFQGAPGPRKILAFGL